MNFKIIENNTESYIIDKGEDSNFNKNDEEGFDNIEEDYSNSQDFTRDNESLGSKNIGQNDEIQIEEEILFSNNFDFWDYIEPEKLLASYLKRKKKIKDKSNEQEKKE